MKNEGAPAFDVSIIIVSYNSSVERLQFSLESIISQKNIKKEVIICDDGSETTHFDEICEYMDSKSFPYYKLIKHDKNGGTVSNLWDGLIASDGEFVKAISPGDALIGDTLLADWTHNLKRSGKGWSFCKVINYVRNNDGEVKAVAVYAHPQDLSVYEKKSDLGCRWNYVAFNDIATGAAILCKKSLILNYSAMIKDKVKFAEDNMYRIMMFHGEVAYYYPVNGILYEYGDGISTSGNSIWNERLRKDWLATDKIMLDEIQNCDTFQKKLIKIIKRQQIDNKIVRRMVSYFDKGRLNFNIKSKLTPRQTDIINL